MPAADVEKPDLAMEQRKIRIVVRVALSARYAHASHGAMGSLMGLFRIRSRADGHRDACLKKEGVAKRFDSPPSGSHPATDLLLRSSDSTLEAPISLPASGICRAHSRRHSNSACLHKSYGRASSASMRWTRSALMTCNSDLKASFSAERASFSTFSSLIALIIGAVRAM